MAKIDSTNPEAVLTAAATQVAAWADTLHDLVPWQTTTKPSTTA